MTDIALAEPLALSEQPADAASDTPYREDAPGERGIRLTMTDLRFFATCYLAGLIFFLVMLS